jgi:hypothetical protein
MRFWWHFYDFIVYCSLDVRQLPLNILFFTILMFSYSNYVIYDFFSLSYNPHSGTEFIPNTLRLWEKWHIFYFIFILYAYWIFVKRDKLLNKLIKFEYENMKLKKRMFSGSCLTSKLYDKISWDYPFKVMMTVVCISYHILWLKDKGPVF